MVQHDASVRVVCFQDGWLNLALTFLEDTVCLRPDSQLVMLQQGNAASSVTETRLVKLPLVGGVEYVYNSQHLLGGGAAGKVYAGGLAADCLQDLHSMAVKVLASGKELGSRNELGSRKERKGNTTTFRHCVKRSTR